MTRALPFLLVAFLALVWGDLVRAESLTGQVVAVADGDTLTLSAATGRVIVRLGGIDAPEGLQPHGGASRAALARLVNGRAVILNTTKHDRYGRRVGQLTVDGQDVGLQMIQGGHAWAFRHYLKELPKARRSEYEQAEAVAKAAGRGLWASPEPVPPWEWRAGHQKGAPRRPADQYSSGSRSVVTLRSHSVMIQTQLSP